MSTVVSKNIQLGADVTSTNNFTWYQPSTPDGTLRLGNGNSGTVSSLLAVTSAGNVGFGTNSPVERVDVSGNIGLAGNLAFTGTARRITGDFSNATHLNRTMFQTSVANSATVVGAIPNGTSAISVFRAFNTADPTNSPFTEISANPGDSRLTAGALGSGTALPLTFYAGGSERMRLDTGGNLGLGVVPSAWWSSSKAIQFSGNLASFYYDGWVGSPVVGFNHYQDTGTSYRYSNNGLASRYLQNAGTHQWFIAPSGTAGNAISFTQAMTLDNVGNLGIGTSAPDARLCVNTTTSGTVARLNTLFEPSGNTAIQIGGYSVGFPNSGAHIRAYHTHNSTANSTLAFEVNGVQEAMRITAGGEVLIGTTDVGLTTGNGYKFITSSAGRNLVINAPASTSANEGYMMYSTGAGAYRFYVQWSGQIHATSTSITAISDASLKENIRDLDTGLTQVLALRPRRFDWRPETHLDEKNVAGFVAQEVEQVLPELVYEYKYAEGNTKKALKMGDILPTLVKAIQEQQSMIEQLKQELAALKRA